MATNYPASVDNGTSLPNPSSSNTQNSPSHSSLHTSENSAIIALENKLGIGASTPSSTGLLLIPTGAGTTAWTQVTSSQLAASISDETGSGSAVFSTSPTLVTPKVDTINEATLGNGVTVGGVGLKAGVVTGSGAGLTAATVGSTSLATNAVQSNQIATTAITLASINSTTSQSGITTSDVLVTNLTTTVTIPTGGRRVEIAVYIPRVFSTTICSPTLSIYNSATVTGTAVQTSKQIMPIANNGITMYTKYEYTPSAGSQSFCAALSVDAGSGSTVLSPTAPIAIAYLTVRVL